MSNTTEGMTEDEITKYYCEKISEALYPLIRDFSDDITKIYKRQLAFGLPSEGELNKIAERIIKNEC